MCNLEYQRAGEKEEEEDKILNENNIEVSVITESEKKLQRTKETEHCTVTEQWQLELFSVCGVKNTAVMCWVQIQSTSPVVLNCH